MTSNNELTLESVVERIRENDVDVDYSHRWDFTQSWAGAEALVKAYVDQEVAKARAEIIKQTEFWQFCYPDGMTAEDVLSELKDLQALSEKLQAIAYEISDGAISKPTYETQVYLDFIEEGKQKAIAEAQNSDD